jgi:hypothetical protein
VQELEGLVRGKQSGLCAGLAWEFSEKQNANERVVLEAVGVFGNIQKTIGAGEGD